MRDYIRDIFYCFKISVKVAIIPIVLGAVISILYLLINGKSLGVIEIGMGIRNTGILFASLGLFICAAAFLQPTKLIRPLHYEETWKTYLNKFGLVGCMMCCSIFLMSYFLILDLVLYAIA